MSMNAASSLYVHPELTDSEVWFGSSTTSVTSSKPAAAAAGLASKTAVYATLATISLAAASALTVLKLTGVGNLIQDSPFVKRWL